MQCLGSSCNGGFPAEPLPDMLPLMPCDMSACCSVDHRCLLMHFAATACRATAMHQSMGSSDGSLAVSQIADLDRRNTALHTELAGARQELQTMHAQLQTAQQELNQLREVRACRIAS